MYVQQVVDDIREVGCWDEALGRTRILNTRMTS